jgi:hypothetical protein
MRRKWRMEMRWRYRDCIQPHGLNLATVLGTAAAQCQQLMPAWCEVGMLPRFCALDHRITVCFGKESC